MNFPFIAEEAVGTVLIALLAFLAVKGKAIDVPGAISGFVISFVSFLAGGFQWLIMIVAFFGVSSAVTRYRYDYKSKLGSAQEKSGIRSWPNTLANGGVAGVAALLELILHSQVFVLAFVGSIAAATSDTLATEVGLLSKSRPRLITNPGTVVKKGTSGGVTTLGELTAIVSALTISALGIFTLIPDRPFIIQPVLAFGSTVIGAVAGTTIDSLIGANLQAVWRCPECGELVEHRFHHGREAKLAKGVAFIDNNIVNAIGVASAALISIVLYFGLSNSFSP